MHESFRGWLLKASLVFVQLVSLHLVVCGRGLGGQLISKYLLKHRDALGFEPPRAE